jgi:Subtilase family
MPRRVLRALVPVVVVGALAAPLTGSAAAASPPPAGHSATVSPAAYLRSHGTTPTTFRGAAPASARRLPSTPGLDPQAAHQSPTANGLVRVAVSGPTAKVAAAVRRAGGRVLARADGTSSVVAPKARLASLAAAAGVSAVRAPERPYALDATNEGVAASEADLWHTAGQGGAGVKLAIVDIGFGSSSAEYDAAVTAGELGTNPVLKNESCTDATNAASAYVDPHGLAVAEIAHDEAPDAQLYLFCMGDITGMAQAEADIAAAGIKIVSSSVGWYGDSRGDGTGPTDSAATVVRRARQAGILWVQAAGNDATSHWGRTMGDSDHDGYLDINGAWNPSKNIYEDDFVYALPHSTGVAVWLQWDQWPTSSAPITLELYGVQCTAKWGTGGVDNCKGAFINPNAGNDGPLPLTSTHTPGDQPTLEVDTSAYPNTGAFDQVWEVAASDSGTFPTTRYDFDYVGDLDGPSDNACPTADAQGFCTNPPPDAYSGTVISPANSPYALAVGAADVGTDDASAKGHLEFFSSRGPTIDGRVKPEITGWDGVSTSVTEYSGGFFGTSAAAPQVAGAAALVLGANSTMDAAQVQDFLERRAGDGAPTDPPSNATGHGLLTLGDATGIVPPDGADYTAITPRRILDTRTTLGGHKGALGAGQTLTAGVGTSVPGDATAVAVNLTGVGARGKTFLAAFTGATKWPGTSNLNLAQADPTAAVFAVVRISSGHRSISVRNSSIPVDVLVDVVGYFRTGGGTGRYNALPTPNRVLDTRTSLGGHHGKVTSTRSAILSPGVPAGATAVILNVTAVGAAGSGHLAVTPNCTRSTSTLNFTRYTRANLAVVALNGSTGTFCVTDSVTGVDVLVDVLGYLSPTGAQYYALPAARRVVDTRTGNGGNANGHSPRPLAANSQANFYGANVGEVPAAATALLTGALEASSTAAGHLSVFPQGAPANSASTLNFTTGRTVANAAVVGVPVGSHQFGVFNSAGATQVSIDLFGYFA